MTFRFCIGFMFQNECAWLKIHLPVLLKSSAVDGIVAVDGGSSDGGADYLHALGATVLHRPWDWKPLDQENAVIELAEREGYDAMLLTAPDELWWPHHLDKIKAMLEQRQHHALLFPTFNFVKDRRHFAPKQPYFPDVHIRAWRLNEGIRHVRPIDSVPNVPHGKWTPVMDVTMYHYSHIKPRDWYSLKGLNFNRVKEGLPPLDKLPDDVPVEPYPYHEPFTGMQPLEPDECGERAPYAN
mgnify:CR=1 FL=1